MRQFTAILVMFTLFLIPNLAYAHAELVGAIPLADTVIKEKTNELQLAFDTNIEQGSTFTVQDETGRKIPVQQIQVHGKQMIGTTSTILPNGNITVAWSAIGADGHTSQGHYQFQVQNRGVGSSIQPSQPQTDRGWLPYLPLFLGAAGMIIFALVLRFLKKKSHSE
jgi:copper resistance protein C